jgi:glucose/arabinose dehydrogenase
MRLLIQSVSLLAFLSIAGCDHFAFSPSVIAEHNRMTSSGYRLERVFLPLKIALPVEVTHAGDGSDRLFIVDQKGIIHVAENNRSTEKADVFLDISDRVHYQSNYNEQGLLGLAFHPKFDENGLLFVYYIAMRNKERTTVVSCFRCSDPEHLVVDPKSEREIWTDKQPYWNHNGGSMAFGPDGFLYIGMGDGGGAGDPDQNAQNLASPFGKILRIDVDHSDSEKNYRVPEDNPFAETPGALPEVFAYGLRNPWKISFDKQTGALWVADVGQDKWEEVNRITKGGNFGWSAMEGIQSFRKGAVDPGQHQVPRWTYPHDENWGKSITGGFVYRGKALPKIHGCYLCGDYISGKLWALRLDNLDRVTEVHSIEFPQNLPIVSIGQDEQGEPIITTFTSGGMFFRIVDQPADTMESDPAKSAAIPTSQIKRTGTGS